MAIKSEIDSLLAGDEKLQQFLTWVHKKSSYIDTSLPIKFKPSAIRSVYFALDRNLDPYLSVTLDRKLNGYKNFDINYIRKFCGTWCPSIREILWNGDMSTDLRICISLSWDTNHYIDSQLILLLDYATHYQCPTHQPGCTNMTSCYLIEHIIQKITDNDFRNILQKLKKELPEAKDKSRESRFSWQECQQWWKNNRKNWTVQLKFAMVKYRNISYDWQFTEEQNHLINMYYDANKLLVIDYLNYSRAVSKSVKDNIESTVLLPLDEIRTRLPHY